jgi:hypothetical protein
MVRERNKDQKDVEKEFLPTRCIVMKLIEGPLESDR